MSYVTCLCCSIMWFGHVTRHDNLSKTIFQGTLEGGRRRGRQGKCWMDNVKEWTSLPMPELLTRASCRKDWKRISAESFLMSRRRSNRSRDRTESCLRNGIELPEWQRDTEHDSAVEWLLVTQAKFSSCCLSERSFEFEQKNTLWNVY